MVVLHAAERTAEGTEGGTEGTAENPPTKVKMQNGKWVKCSNADDDSDTTSSAHGDPIKIRAKAKRAAKRQLEKNK